MNRGLLLGLDGLDFDFVKTNRESLPALDQLISTGTWGRLRSTIPPATSAAWTAGLSGMNPGRTGVSDFTTGDNDKIVNSTDVRVPRLWDVVRANGGKTATIGVPVTYPVSAECGAMVSGFLSDADGDRVWPPDLESILPEEYKFFVSHEEGDDRNRVLEAIYSSTDAKFDLLERAVTDGLPTAEDPSLVTFVLSEPDWIQHYVRRQPVSSRYEEGETDVLSYLEHVDNRIADLLELLDDDWVVASMSDHGFGKHTSHYVYMNEWLSRRGDLTLAGGTSGSLKQSVGRNIGRLLRIPGVKFMKQFLPSNVRDSVAATQTLSEDAIDWSETSARFDRIFANCGAIRINHPEVDDIDVLIDDLVAGLESLTDPETGEPVVATVHRREEYYAGANVDSLPEIVFVYREPYTGRELVGETNVVRKLSSSERPPVHHKMDGYFVFSGPSIETDRRRDATIYDVAPTLYTALNIPVPEQTDGDVIDCFKNPSLMQGSIKTYDFEPIGASQETDAEPRERLEDLGYL